MTALWRSGRTTRRPSPTAGIALQTLGRHVEALASFRAVLAIDKDNADARHNEALALLTVGDFRRGFEGYEQRWQRTGMPPRRRLGKPLWLGEFAPARKTILLHAEQGLGDTIQFVRYAPMLARAGAKVLLEVQPELKDDPGAGRGRRQRDRCAAKRCRPSMCSVRSEACRLRCGPSRRPFRPTFPISRRAKSDWPNGAPGSRRCRVRVSPSPGRATRSMPTTATARSRCRALRRCWRREQGSFISIQRELRSEDAAALAHAPAADCRWARSLHDFDDTAAVVSLADLVITVDTSVAHLAGALGRPTLDPRAVLAGLALDARSRRQPLVSDCASVPPAGAGRLGLGDRAGGRPFGATPPSRDAYGRTITLPITRRSVRALSASPVFARADRPRGRGRELALGAPAGDPVERAAQALRLPADPLAEEHAQHGAALEQRRD